MYCKACSRRIYHINQYNIWISTVSEIFSIIILIVFKTIATLKRHISYARNAVGDSYACEAIAKKERLFTYARDTITDCYARKAIAMFERSLAYARDRQTIMTVYNYFGCRTGTNARNGIAFTVFV